jgi:hypothetical protein
MKLAHRLKYFASLAAAVLVTAACATSGGMQSEMSTDAEPEQVQLHVLNDTDEPTVTVSIEDIEGNVVPLGNVREGENKRLIFRVPGEVDSYRLIAVGPQDADRMDYHISEEFVLTGGASLNWFLAENELEVN